VQNMVMYLDIIGSCNLKCPSCPIGNSINKNNNKSMSFDLLRLIVKKSLSEGISSIHLYNWTEPLIHPKIGEFISEIEGNGIACGISSNLNISKNIESAIKANPSFFRISLSGFYQETYMKGHAGGNIEDVKKHMGLLSELRSKYNSKTRVQVYYHRYLDNSDEEVLMKHFSEGLGFEFSSEFASMMPLEKLFQACDAPDTLSEKDRKVISRLALPPSSEVFNIARQYKNMICSLRENQMTLDCQGNVILCCSVFEQKNNLVGRYTEIPLDQIRLIKNTREDLVSRCTKCMENGMHVYAQCPSYKDLRDFSSKMFIENKANQIGVSVFSKKGSDKFDEEIYLSRNPDVREAVLNGYFRSGYDHYLQFGKSEIAAGRRKSVG